MLKNLLKNVEEPNPIVPLPGLRVQEVLGSPESSLNNLVEVVGNLEFRGNFTIPMRGGNSFSGYQEYDQMTFAYIMRSTDGSGQIPVISYSELPTGPSALRAILMRASKYWEPVVDRKIEIKEGDLFLCQNDSLNLNSVLQYVTALPIAMPSKWT